MGSKEHNKTENVLQVISKDGRQDELILLEIAVLFYASIGRIRTRKNQYPYFMKGYNCRNVINSLIERGFLKIGTAEESIWLYPYKELQSYLSKRGIRPGNRRDVTINRLLEHFDANEIAEFFGYLCYIPTSEAEPICRNYSINDFYNIDFQVNRLHLSEERYKAYIQNDDEVRICIDENSSCLIINDREEKLNKYNDLKQGYKVSLYYCGELKVTYDEISIVIFLRITKHLMFIRKTDQGYEHYPYDYYRSENLHSFCSECVTWNVLSNNDFDVNKIENKIEIINDGYINYYISSSDIIRIMLYELYEKQHKRIKIEQIDKKIIDESDNNYKVKVNIADYEMREFIMYLLHKNYVKFPTLFGVELNRIFNCYRFNLHKNEEGNKYLVEEYNQEHETLAELYNLLMEHNIKTLSDFVKKGCEIYPITIITRGDYRYYITSNYPYSYDETYKSILNKENKFESLYKESILKIHEDGFIPAKWKNEFELYLLVKKYYSDAIYQYRDDWLGLQSLDIYIPSLHVGIEYQGIQHYEAIDFFGGEKSFEDRKLKDDAKRVKCKNNNILLIEWKYTVDVNEKNLNNVLVGNGL